MHSSGSITRIRSAWWMQSTGQTSTQERSLMSMQGSAMMYVKTLRSLARGLVSEEFLDDGADPLDERRLCQHLVEPGGLRSAEPGRVGVVREADDRDFGIRVRDLLRVDPRDVRDHELGLVDVVGRDQMVTAQQRFELAPEEEVDPTQQDHRHCLVSVTLPCVAIESA